MAFIVDITKFQAEGALLNWPVVARRLGMLDATTGDSAAIGAAVALDLE